MKGHPQNQAQRAQVLVLFRAVLRLVSAWGQSTHRDGYARSTNAPKFMALHRRTILRLARAHYVRSFAPIASASDDLWADMRAKIRANPCPVYDDVAFRYGTGLSVSQACRSSREPWGKL